MADVPQIAVKPKELTEAEKAAQALREQKTPEQLKNEQEELDRQARENEAKRILEETRKESQEKLQGVKTEIAPEQINDLPTLDKTLGLKIKEVPRSVPAYLDLIVEKNPKLLEVSGVSALLAQKIQELLLVVAAKPELSRDREWMDSLRQSLNRIIIDPALAKQLTEYSKMDPVLREELQKQL